MITAALKASFPDPTPLARRAPGVLPPGALAIAALKPGDCRWPLGAVDEPTFRFCSMPSRHRSYCEAHRRLAHRSAAR